MSNNYPIKLLCSTLDTNRSTEYYLRREPDDAALSAAIKEVLGTWPTYGYRRVTA